MPASTQKQKRFFKLILLYKAGRLDIDKLPKQLAAKIKKVANGITLKHARDMATQKVVPSIKS